MGRGEIRREDTGRSTSWRRLQNLPAIVSCVAIAIAALYSLTLSPTPRVVMPEDARHVARAPQVYEEAATRIARSSVFNRSKLTVDASAIESRMREQFPEIASIDVTVPLLGRRPVVEMSTIRPAFSLINDTGEYYIAADGRATATVDAYTVRPAAVVKLYDQSGLALQPGKQILTKDTVSFIDEVVLQMQAKRVQVASLTLPAVPFEMQMRLDGVPYYVRFNTLGNARLQSGAFLALKDKLEAQKQKPTEYIDVRVEDRAFYK
jgi:hypothetical protein